MFEQPQKILIEGTVARLPNLRNESRVPSIPMNL
jgi:hypothetical protein